jgi:hypothetical protein
MKKIHVTLIALALAAAAAIVVLIVVPALAQAQKVDLEKAVGAPGGGSVVFNGPAGDIQFEMELVLKRVKPNTAYDVYLDIPYFGVVDWLLDTITTSAAGNANLHHNCPSSDTGGPLPPGSYDFRVHVRLAGSLVDLYFMTGTIIVK